MKKDIHPKWYPDAKVFVEGELVMTVGSTQPEINIEIWSGTHPFYTGTQRLVDTEGQVDRFMRRLQRRENLIKEEEKPAERSPLKLTIDAMSLGTRATNALTEAGISTVGDVMETLQEGEEAILGLPGVGQKALIDIKRFLRAEGLID
ncbi:MAG: 50S ribosomal protein L31 [Anaerolineales bacterium]|nr:50S ribosomal protein L31 [Anaerolineales bacterium]